MSQFYLKIDLKEPVIFSESAASVGGHRSLDYIPGAALLGFSASQLYAELGSKAFDVFHSGKVRFSNAYPLSPDNALCYPIPFAWFYAKGSHYKKNDQQLDADTIFNLMNTEGQGLPEKDGKKPQPKQLRSGYISNQLDLVTTNLSLRMKTAIDPSTAKAASSQLFGYQSLEAGQSFIASISFDDDLDVEIKTKIQKSLEGELFLGRSRSAQYGKVETSIVKIDEINDDKNTAISSDTTTLWLHSDIALNTKEGLPINAGTLASALATSLDIPESKTSQSGLINWAKSNLRFRHYSPYNAYRNAYDMQRQVIEKGSVICLNIDSRHFDKMPHTIGLYQAQGLGHLEINHPLLAKEKPATELANITVSSEQIAEEIFEKPVNNALVNWLDNKYKKQETSRDDRNEAEKIGAKVTGLYEQARLYAGIANHLPIGPTTTQWGLISDAGKQYQNKGSALQKSLKNICKSDDKDWSTTTFATNKDKQQEETTFSRWLLKNLENQSGQVVSLVARIAQGSLTQQKQKGAKHDSQ